MLLSTKESNDEVFPCKTAHFVSLAGLKNKLTAQYDAAESKTGLIWTHYSIVMDDNII